MPIRQSIRRLTTALGILVALLPIFAQFPLPAQAGKIKIVVYNQTNERVWITMYKSAIGRSIVCSGWAHPKNVMACEPNFWGLDDNLWVRGEVVNGAGGVISDIEVKGSPRVLTSVTVFRQDNRYHIRGGAP